MTANQHRLSQIVAAGGLAGAILGLLPKLLWSLDVLLFSWASASAPAKLVPLDALIAVLGVFYAVLIGAAIALFSAPLVSPGLAAAQRADKTTPVICSAIGGLGAVATLVAICMALALIATLDDTDVFAGNSELLTYLRWFVLGGPVAGYIYWHLEEHSAQSSRADCEQITRPSPTRAERHR